MKYVVTVKAYGHVSVRVVEATSPSKATSKVLRALGVAITVEPVS